MGIAAKLKWDAAKQEVIGDAEAAGMTAPRRRKPRAF